MLCDWLFSFVLVKCVLGAFSQSKVEKDSNFTVLLLFTALYCSLLLSTLLDSGGTLSSS